MKKVIVLLALLVAACASYSGSNLKPGQSTEADVRASMGAPALELAEPDGGRKLAYPRGPNGLTTLLVGIAPSGTMLSIEQVLDEGHFQKIQRGVHGREDVLRLIGPPWRTTEFARKGQVAWDYRFRDAWGYVAEFSVMFDAAGIAVETFTARLEPRDRND